METVNRTAAERREQIQARAAAMGIDEAYISDLVEDFYQKIRADEQLGPIFNNAIKDNWPEHLERMKTFWASVALNAGGYSGKPVPKHQKLNEPESNNVQPPHFDQWLSLFRKTLNETAPTPDAIPYFMERATRIAASLQLAMFGMPGLPPRDTATKREKEAQ